MPFPHGHATNCWHATPNCTAATISLCPISSFPFWALARKTVGRFCFENDKFWICTIKNLRNHSKFGPKRLMLTKVPLYLLRLNGRQGVDLTQELKFWEAWFPAETALNFALVFVSGRGCGSLQLKVQEMKIYTDQNLSPCRKRISVHVMSQLKFCPDLIFYASQTIVSPIPWVFSSPFWIPWIRHWERTNACKWCDVCCRVIVTSPHSSSWNNSRTNCGLIYDYEALAAPIGKQCQH